MFLLVIHFVFAMESNCHICDALSLFFAEHFDCTSSHVARNVLQREKVQTDDGLLVWQEEDLATGHS